MRRSRLLFAMAHGFSGSTNRLVRVAPDSVVGRLLRLPLRPMRNACVPILQGPLKGKRWLASAGIHSLWLGVYEHTKQVAFGSALRPGDVVLDIGAHAGYYSLFASDRVGPRGHVYAFEPLPRNVVFLQRHVRLNSAENVTVFSTAVSDRCGVAPFQEGFESSTGRLDDEGTLVVSTVSLDELHRHGWIPHPDLVKIDVEGAELAVLEGGGNSSPLRFRRSSSLFTAMR